MYDETKTNKPTDRLRDGLLEAAIWANPSKDGNGQRYSVEFTRRYQAGDGEWQTSRTFSNAELLRLAYLATQAYGRINQLRSTDQAA